MANIKNKKSKKKPIATTKDENGVEWAPLVDILNLIKSKGIPKTVTSLRKEITRRGIPVRKMKITRSHNWQDVWALPLVDYKQIMKESEHLLYLYLLDPNNPSPCDLKIKIGYSNSPIRGRGKNYRTTNPGCRLLWMGFVHKQWEKAAIAYATADIAISEGKDSNSFNSCEVFMCLNKDNLKQVEARLQRFVQEIMPPIQKKPLKKDDFYFDKATDSWLPIIIPNQDTAEDEKLDAQTENSSVVVRDGWEALVKEMIQFRKLHSKSQRWFADQIGISDKSISNYEREKVKASPGLQNKIQKFITNFGKNSNIQQTLVSADACKL